jgi:hypothetical protein
VCEVRLDGIEHCRWAWPLPVGIGNGVVQTHCTVIVIVDGSVALLVETAASFYNLLLILIFIKLTEKKKVAFIN